MKELTRTQLAIIKRTAQNVKGLRTKLAKINENLESLTVEAFELNNTIEQFEAPIRTMTGGFTSEEVLNGTMDEVTQRIETIEQASELIEQIEDCVKNEVENTTGNVKSEFQKNMEEIGDYLEAQDNVSFKVSNEIPFI